MRKTLRSFVAPIAGAFIAAALLCSSPAQADSFSTPDKPKHFAVSLALGAGASAIVKDDRTAFALAMAPGFAKELLDMRRGGSGFSWRDLVADAAGAYVGVKLGGLIIRPRFIGISKEINL